MTPTGAGARSQGATMPSAVGATAAIGCEASLGDYVALMKPRVIGKCFTKSRTSTIELFMVLFE